MVLNLFLGILKFFQNEKYLDELISGVFRCTPPEIYRNNDEKGKSDKFESCFLSYRPERNDEPMILKVGDYEISDLLGLTIYNKNYTDSWMHCWFIFQLPKDEEALKLLNTEIQRMQQEFGNNYAFIPSANLKPFVNRLKKLSSKKMYCGSVKYSPEKHDWENLCKGLDFSYQREYRFLFGECSSSEKEPYVIEDPKGFGSLILKNPNLKLESNDKKVIWFELNKTNKTDT
jgi:hypothetical protein